MTAEITGATIRMSDTIEIMTDGTKATGGTMIGETIMTEEDITTTGVTTAEVAPDIIETDINQMYSLSRM